MCECFVFLEDCCLLVFVDPSASVNDAEAQCILQTRATLCCWRHSDLQSHTAFVSVRHSIREQID